MNFWLDLYETLEQPTSVAKKHLGWAASIGDGRHNIFWYLIYYRTHIYRPLMDWAWIGEKENMCRAKDFFKFSSTAKKTLHGYYPELSVGNIGLYQLCPAPPWQILRGCSSYTTKQTYPLYFIAIVESISRKSTRFYLGRHHSIWLMPRQR